MTGAQIVIIVTIICYLGGMLLIGLYFNRMGSGNSSSDFYIGGRSLGPIVTAMSAEASDMSSYLLMGIGLAVGTYLNFLLVARKLRRYSDEVGAFTIPDFFSRRYNDSKHHISIVAALIILIFFIPYTASGFKAVGTLFNSLFNIEYHVAMIFGAVIIISYTVLGGFLAVSTTDLVQSIFMSIALVVIVIFGIIQAGGMGSVIQNAKALPGYLNLTQGYDASTGQASSFGLFSIVSTLAWVSARRKSLSHPEESHRSGVFFPWALQSSSVSSDTVYLWQAKSPCSQRAPILRRSLSKWQTL